MVGLMLVMACSPTPSGEDATTPFVDTSTEDTTPEDTSPTTGVVETGESSTTEVPGPLIVEDMGPASGYDDTFGGNWKRGRAAVVFDIDGDGDFDVFSGNPGDLSYVLMNVSSGGVLRFEQGQVLDDTAGMWGGTAGDYDNDGDQDLFISMGGNEPDQSGYDRLYENINGVLHDVSESSGTVAGDYLGRPIETNHASAFFWDLNNDGWLDIFSNHHVVNRVKAVPDSGLGANNFFINQGDGTFQDARVGYNMEHQLNTRTSAYLDFDNDGDLDLYENNWSSPSILWRNLLMETGSVGFVDVTEEMSIGGGNLSLPSNAGPMAAVARDFNQDGWEDLLVFRRGERKDSEPASHPNGHLLWINLQGTGFVEVAEHTGVNTDFPVGVLEEEKGVMGSQAADLNADSIPDVYCGNGGPTVGREDNLLVSTGFTTITHPEVGDLVVPTYENWAHHIDFPSESEALNPTFVGGLYPYRTHGTTFADYDGDGLYELGVHNGGRAVSTDAEAQSPNQLWKFTFPIRPHWIRVQLKGDGVTVPLDPIGTRVRALVSSPDGERWVYSAKRSGSGFGAQNDPDVFLGLGDAEELLELWVTWPGSLGEKEIPVSGMDQRYPVVYAP